MILKGYELLKEIADGKIKKGAKISIIFKDNSTESFTYDGDDIVDSIYRNIFNIYGIKAVLEQDFIIEESEQEIDIQAIEELVLDQLKERKHTNADIYMLGVQINALIRAVKQLDNKNKEK